MAYRLSAQLEKISFKKAFKADQSGSTTTQTAMLFGAIAMALSVLVAPQLQSAVEVYAENKALGIDHVITGSVKPSKQYTVRKSVLDK
ncbi:MAG: hypothetical protein WBC71_06005 [Salaquimonas sp.]